MYGYIYKTENLINGKTYVGQRKKSFFDLHYKGSGTIIKNALKKYGFDNFDCTILTWCDSQEQMNRMETLWIKMIQPDYNIYKVGYQNEVTVESSRVHSEIQKNYFIKNPDAKKKLSEKQKKAHGSPEKREVARKNRLRYMKENPEGTMAMIKRMKERIAEPAVREKWLQTYIGNHESKLIAIDFDLLGFAKGTKKTCSEWGRIVQIERSVILSRIKRGWSIKDALTKKPVARYEAGKISATIDISGIKAGTFLNKTEWSMITGIKRTTICQRLHCGWSIEKTLTEVRK